MGLADPRKRTKISHDPNNTTWTRSTDNYGQRIMRSQGWTPGSFLGAHNAAHTQHFTAGSASFVRAVLKDDTMGLGAKPHSKKAEDEPTGLDAFQDLLGRLNGKSEVELATEQRRRDDVKLLGYVEKRWKSMNFVRGGTLAQEKMPESSVPRTGTDGGAQQSSKDLKKKQKKKKIASGEGGKSKDGTSDQVRSKEKSAKVKDKKKDNKKQRDSKNRKAEISGSDSPSEDASELAKSKRKRKRKEKAKDHLKSGEATANESRSPPPKTEEIPTPASKPTRGLVVSKENRPVGRQALRSRHIEQKKRALMDDKSLNEIFMVTS